jgi:small ligand-binding sensory domain FIST
MRFHAAISSHESTDNAITEVIESARRQNLNSDLAFVFFTGHHCPESERMTERLWLELDPQVLIGCSAEGVIGGDLEIERAPGLSVLIGELPQDVRIHPFHTARGQWREMISDRDALVEHLGHGSESRAIIAFGDPFTTPINQLLPLLDEVAPNAPLVGGMASAGRQPGHNILVRNDQTFGEGLVGVTLSGPIAVDTLVSQGCRPVGQTFVITKAHDNVIETLGGKPAILVLQDMVTSLAPEDQDLLQKGLLIGRAISEYRERFTRGDFLIRNIVGADQATGAIALADYVRVGQTVQFHVRDARTADEDLNLMLQAQLAASSAPAAALLFSCNGRGTNLFDQQCHDVGAVRSAMSQTPVAGFFAAGELGPVGNKNFIHGHTASLALLRALVPSPGTPGEG